MTKPPDEQEMEGNCRDLNAYGELQTIRKKDTFDPGMKEKRTININSGLLVPEEFRALPGNRKLEPDIFVRFNKTILSYYQREGRDLAWRRTTDPYHIFVSEIMLQQTQIGRVTIKYPEFITTFPTFAALADAPLHQVLAVWQGMGYNRRAIALHKCAKQVMTTFGGELPRDVGTLVTLPGIGHATACSIGAFAFNMPVAFIETNIRRVFIHFFFPDRLSVTDREILPLVKQSLDTTNPRVWYWALMVYDACGSISHYGAIVNTSISSPDYLYQFLNSILSCMKSRSKQCPNNHGAMHRVHIKTTKDKVQSWQAIGWQYCPVCRIMLPD
jgi:endonuclease III